jgi:hypothetical protein
MLRTFTAVVLALLTFCICQLQADANWTRFRGPNGQGIWTGEVATPVEFSDSENLRWKVALPGPGSSSPIVLEDRVYVTCWTGYGLDRSNPGEQSDLRRHLLCLDAATGETVWDRSVKPVLPEDEYRGMFTQHGYASHTPVTDGERIYVYFGKTGALAFDLDGKRLWHTKVGTELDPRGWGSAASPIIYKDLLIVTATAECEGMVGLDKATGREVWRQEAAGFNGSWSTPVLVPAGQGRVDMVIGVPGEIWGLSPKTGLLRWYCQSVEDTSFCSSLAVVEDTVYAIEGRGGGSIAVRVGGRGEVTDSHVLWRGRHTNRIGSPIAYQGRIYFFSQGIANCIDAETGERLFQDRLRGPGRSSGGRGTTGRRRRGFTSSDYSSPIIADGKLYFVSRSGDVYVLRAIDRFEQLAVNRVTDDREDFSATPAVSGGALFIRSDQHLYCAAKSDSP